MTTEPKNELPDVINYLLGEGQFEGFSYPDFPDNGERYKRRYWWRKALRDAWNTRAAKAVQGDKAEAWKRIKRFISRAGVSYLDTVGGDNVADMNTIEAALTPESEGIAGKGDAFEKAIEEWRIYQSKYIGGYGVSSVNDLVDSIIRSGRALALSTLTRPQEIDVEALKRDIEVFLGKKWEAESHNGKHKHHYLGGINTAAISDIIDHLAASGYLPDVKANLTQGAPNVSQAAQPESGE